LHTNFTTVWNVYKGGKIFKKIYFFELIILTILLFRLKYI